MVSCFNYHGIFHVLPIYLVYVAQVFVSKKIVKLYPTRCYTFNLDALTMRHKAYQIMRIHVGGSFIPWTGSCENMNGQGHLSIGLGSFWMFRDCCTVFQNAFASNTKIVDASNRPECPANPILDCRIVCLFLPAFLFFDNPAAFTVSNREDNVVQPRQTPFNAPRTGIFLRPSKEVANSREPLLNLSVKIDLLGFLA